MTGNATIALIPAYFQEPAEITPFFTGMFRVPQGGYYNSEFVEIDIVRSGEDIAIVIQDMSTGPRWNSNDLYTNKQFKAPVFDEAIGVNSFDLIRRLPGDSPFKDPNYRINLVFQIIRGMRKAEGKIRRAIEQMCAQIMQTGTLSLIDTNGVVLYTIDFKPKATHFPTAGTSWASATTAQKLADIQSLAGVIRADGLAEVDQLIMGDNVINNLLLDAGIQSLLDNRRIEGNQITELRKAGGGATSHGFLTVGQYRFELLSYASRYKHPQTGVSTKYMHGGKIIMRASAGRLDMTYGNIPHVGRELGITQDLLPELPSRFSGEGMDLHPKAWLTQDGSQLNAAVGTRPLPIPVAIDTYGALNTQLPA